PLARARECGDSGDAGWSLRPQLQPQVSATPRHRARHRRRKAAASGLTSGDSPSRESGADAIASAVMKTTTLLLVSSFALGGVGCVLEEAAPEPGLGLGLAAEAAVAPTLFRVSRLELLDPHVTYDFFGCRDLTNTPLFTFTGVNAGIAERIANLELNVGLVFQPLDPTAPGGDVAVGGLTCTE